MHTEAEYMSIGETFRATDDGTNTENNPGIKDVKVLMLQDFMKMTTSSLENQIWSGCIDKEASGTAASDALFIMN